MKSERKKYVDKKLITRLRLFALIFLIMCAVGIYDTVIGVIAPGIALAAIAGGVGLGLLIGRIYNVVWHEETGTAISKMDVFGVIILLAYILFAIFRKKLFGHWFAGHQLSAFIMCISAGVMLGRLLTLRTMIINVLKSQRLY